MDYAVDAVPGRVSVDLDDRATQHIAVAHGCENFEALAFRAMIQDDAIGLELLQSGEAVRPIGCLDHNNAVPLERVTDA
ncbi:MAG TPA: hypothetical protein VIF34_02605 [Methylocystis sp.]